MRAVIIEDVVKETPDTSSFYFQTIGEAKPGQYVMVWIPGIDEIPMSLSKIGDRMSITVKVVGEATKALSMLNKSDRIGIRGPYGKFYKITGESPLLIGGGTGIASLTPLAEFMVNQGVKPTFLIGARSTNQLLYRNRLNKLLGSNLLISTDDGSEGYHGYASSYVFDLLATKLYDSLYVCGPELMMAIIWREAEKYGLPIQASLERLCKCAVGLCGSCAIGPYRVCTDGPVFDTSMLRKVVGDLGQRRMDASGKMILVDH